MPDEFINPHNDREWSVPNTWQGVQIALLMDIRRQLYKLNNLLHCENFKMIPAKLDRIGRNTAKPKRKRKPVAKKKAAKK